MTYTQTQVRLGPDVTPPMIKILILLTCVVSFAAALVNPYLIQHGVPSLTDLLSLSWKGLTQGYVWQPVSSLFLHPDYGWGITTSLLIDLLFSMYLLWFAGTAIIERIGAGSFVALYLISGIISGLVAIGVGQIVGIPTTWAGSSLPLLTILFLWTMIYPEAQILLFFVLPIKAKWLMAGIVGAILLINLSQGDAVTIAGYLTAIVFGYLYGVIALHLPSPYDVTRRIDSAILNLTAPAPPKPKSTGPKIIDINTGAPLSDDDNFVDAMLEKISKSGEDSLSRAERQRLHRISAQKKK